MKTRHIVSLLIVVLCLLVSVDYLSAWTAAPPSPPQNNAAAPINTSATVQTKTGDMIARIFAAVTEMRSDRYCDRLGQNCARAGSFSLPVCAQGQTLIADATGQWQCTTPTTPPPPPPPPPPPTPAGNWYQAANRSCTNYCSSIGKVSANDPNKGTMCVSGESSLDPAFGIPMSYPYGTWGSLAGDVGGHYQTQVTRYQTCPLGYMGRNQTPCTPSNPVTTNYCYANGQKADGDVTDISVGCYCK